MSRVISDRRKLKRHASYHVYIIQCADGTYYTGSTYNLKNRIRLHNSGNGAKYLRGKGPLKLVFVKGYRSNSRALKAEDHIKKLNRQRKMEMIRIYKSKCHPSSRRFAAERSEAADGISVGAFDNRKSASHD